MKQRLSNLRYRRIIVMRILKKIILEKETLLKKLAKIVYLDIAGDCTLGFESNHKWRIHNRLNTISILTFRRHHKLSNRLTSHPTMTVLYLDELLYRLSQIELLIWLTISFIANVCLSQITGSSKRTYSTNAGSNFCLFSISAGFTAFRIWFPCRVY